MNKENPVTKVFKAQSPYVQCQAFTNSLQKSNRNVPFRDSRV
jgi:hypothetical protein